MLTLRRKSGESFFCFFDGKKVFVKVGEIKPNRIELLIQADPEIRILRTELLTDKEKNDE